MQFKGELNAAVAAKIAEHAAAKGVDQLSPDYLKLFTPEVVNK